MAFALTGAVVINLVTLRILFSMSAISALYSVFLISPLVLVIFLSKLSIFFGTLILLRKKIMNHPYTISFILIQLL